MCEDTKGNKIILEKKKGGDVNVANQTFSRKQRTTRGCHDASSLESALEAAIPDSFLFTHYRIIRTEESSLIFLFNQTVLDAKVLAEAMTPKDVAYLLPWMNKAARFPKKETSKSKMVQAWDVFPLQFPLKQAGVLMVSRLVEKKD